MISRRHYLNRGQPPKRKSWVKRSTKPIPQVNVEATARRRVRNAKRMRGPQYRAAKAGAMERADGQCEYRWSPRMRCPATERLQFHEHRYPKSRPLSKDDGLIYCFTHHMLVESQKLHKAGKRGFA